MDRKMGGFSRASKYCLCLCSLSLSLWPESRTRSCSDRYCVLTTTQSHRRTDGRTQTNPIREPHTYTYTYHVNGHLHRTGCSGRPTRSRPWLLSICGCSALVLRVDCVSFPFVRSFLSLFRRIGTLEFSCIRIRMVRPSVRPFVRWRTHVFFVRHGWADPHPHPLLIAFYIMIVSYVYIVVGCWPVRVTPD